MGGETLPLKDLARLRQCVYRLFGAVLLSPSPDEEWIATLPRVAEELWEESEPFAGFAFWGRWERLLGSLRRLKDTDRPALEATYIHEFQLPSDEATGLPYESSYLPPQERPWVLAGLDREYSRNGFTLAPSFGEPPDHASVELDFMSLLCRLEAEAWREENVRDAVEALERERSFLLQHLLRWFPEFARRVSNRDGDGFYALATDAAQAFIAHDLDLVTSLLGRFQEGAKG